MGKLTVHCANVDILRSLALCLKNNNIVYKTFFLEKLAK